LPIVHGPGVPYEYEGDEAAPSEEGSGPLLTRPDDVP
jgi:hypothetical protein